MSIISLILDRFPNDVFDYIFISVEFVVSFVAVVMMLMTRPKKPIIIPERDPSRSITSKSEYIEEQKDNPIRVTLNLEFNIQEMISFKVETDNLTVVVKRKFNEFIDLENFLLEYIQHYLPEHINAVPIIDKTDFKENSRIVSAFERRLRNLNLFLQDIAMK